MRVFFLRDENKFPVACFASELEGDTVKYAFSIHNPIDPFDRHRARRIATERLSKGKGHSGQFVGKVTKEKPKKQILSLVANDKHIPNRVREAAVLWLERRPPAGPAVLRA